MDIYAKRDTVLKLRAACEALINELNELAPNSPGTTITFWCSSNDPGWKFDIERYAK